MVGISNISASHRCAIRKCLICYVAFWACLLGVTLGWESNPDCDVGWDGPDCTIPYEKCIDDGERKCYNGSKCVRNNVKDSDTGHYNFHCDCTAAQGVSAYAGRECEHAATEYCNYEGSDVHNTISTFCTNGGTCILFQLNGRGHTGCNCPEEYSGSHCQYLKGVKGDFPDNNPLYVDGANVYGSEKRSERKNRASAVTVTAILGALMITSLLGIFGFFMYRKYSNQTHLKESKEKPITENPSYEGDHFKIDDSVEML